MTPEELLLIIDSTSEEELVTFLADDSNAISFCFLNAVPSFEVNKIFEQMVSSLAQKQLSNKLRDSSEIQSLYVHLAFYFKRINKRDYVDTCVTHIQNNVFKKRLSAWLHYKRYTVHKMHVTEFENYLTKLNSALYDDSEEFTYEVLSDLFEYRTIGLAKLSLENKAQMDLLFLNPDLKVRFPILAKLTEDPSLFMPAMEIAEADKKIRVPSVLIQNIFETNFLDDMKGKNLYGYTIDEATEKIIKKGQANFDENFKELSSEDVVKLYCYLNMRMHYFSSLSLYERSELIKFYSTKGRIKLIDIGCGPGTSGLAFATYLFEESNELAVFDYFGIDSAITMYQYAKNMLNKDIFAGEEHVSFYDRISNIDLNDLANSTCIIINACYVFASESLDINEIAEFIKTLQLKFPYIPKFLAYQNLAKKDSNLWANQKYFDLKALLDNSESLYCDYNGIIRYYNQRTMFGDPKRKEVFFEILKL